MNYYTAEFEEKVPMMYHHREFSPITYKTEYPSIILFGQLRDMCEKCGLIMTVLRPATDDEIKMYEAFVGTNKYPKVEVIGHNIRLRFV